MISLEKNTLKNERIEILTQKTIRNKLLEYFRIEALKNRSKIIYLKSTWQDLADYLAIDRCAMTRELKYLKEEGFISDYEVKEEGKFKVISITLKYDANHKSVITKMERISKPGLRVYAGADELPTVLNGLGIAIISTSKGIMTDKEARANSLGGEVIAYVW